MDAILLLALGNDILGDDGVGLAAAKALQPDWQDRVRIVDTPESGLALIDLLEGSHRALLLDAIVTGGHPPGTILEFTGDDLGKVPAPSVHQAGLPDLLRLADQVGLAMPSELRILAMVVSDSWTLREGLSPAIQAALPAYVERAREILDRWVGRDGAGAAVFQISRNHPRFPIFHD